MNYMAALKSLLIGMHIHELHGRIEVLANWDAYPRNESNVFEDNGTVTRDR